MVAKVSLAIGEEELGWARAVARREGKSLSAVVTESLAARRPRRAKERRATPLSPAF